MTRRGSDPALFDDHSIRHHVESAREIVSSGRIRVERACDVSTDGSKAGGRLKSIAVASKPLLVAAGWGTDCWRAHIDQATVAISLDRRD